MRRTLSNDALYFSGMSLLFVTRYPPKVKNCNIYFKSDNYDKYQYYG